MSNIVPKLFLFPWNTNYQMLYETKKLMFNLGLKIQITASFKYGIKITSFNY